MEVDRRSNEAVYRQHADELVRIATGVVGADDAPDVLADAFIRICRSAVWEKARNRRALWLRAVLFETQSTLRSSARRRERERRVAVPTAAECHDDVAMSLRFALPLIPQL